MAVASLDLAAPKTMEGARQVLKTKLKNIEQFNKMQIIGFGSFSSNHIGQANIILSRLNNLQQGFKMKNYGSVIDPSNI